MGNLKAMLIRWFDGLREAATQGAGWKPALIRYGIGIVGGAAAMGLRLTLVPLIGSPSPGLILYPTVLFIALGLGVGPGMAAAVTGLTISEATLIHPPGGSISVPLISRWMYIILGAAVAGYFGSRLRQARRVAETAAAERARLSMKLADARDRERREIAAWLHDNIGQMLTALGLSLDEAVRNERNPARASRSIREAEQVLGQVTDQVRNMTYELDSPVLRKLGLDDALDELCEHIGSRFGLRCTYDGSGDVTACAKGIDGVLYDAVRELLHNVVKHSGARSVAVHAACVNGQVRVTVEDDGKGFDPAAVKNLFSRNGGFGLYRLQERIEQLGGRLQLLSSKGSGTRVIVEMPRARPGSRADNDE